MALFDPSRVMQAQIDSGYRGTDYAIAEIIDNSIEANAENIDVYLIEKIKGAQRKVWRVNEIVIVDNGSGMPKEILDNVLTFGYGTHEHEVDSQTKGYGQLGKYGFGLPNSSVSQANDIHVWSWQNNIENSLHTSLNVTHIINKDATEQTKAEHKHVSKRILGVLKTTKFPIAKTGTLVYWNDTERCSWTVGKAIIRHLEETVGRIFRHFIHKSHIQIRIFLLRENELGNPQYQCTLKPNDPLFLMTDSLGHTLINKGDLPNGDSPFDPYPFDKPSVYDIKVPYEGKECIVKLRFSMTKKKFRQRPPYGGLSAFGKLARDNEGFSICREGRELQLSRNWLVADTRERWWGAEVDFPRALDNVFGVTNNKQAATKLEEMANVDLQAFADEYQEQSDELNQSNLNAKTLSYRQMIDDMKKNQDMRWVLLEIASIFQKEVGILRNNIKKMPESATEQETEGGKVSPQPGNSGFGKGINPITNVVNKPTEKPTDEQIVDTVHKLIDDLDDPSPDTFEQLKIWLGSKEENVMFKVKDLDSSNFFSCRTDFGKYLITLNEGHPAFETLFQVIQDLAFEGDVQEQLTRDQMIDKIDGIRVCLALMLYAWAEAENNEIQETKKLARRLRETWGEKLDELLMEYKKQTMN